MFREQTGKLLKRISHQSSLPTFTMGAQPMVLWWEALSAPWVCAACRENTFLLTAWLKLDHQMASLHLSRHLIKIRSLWSILSRITALMWSGINIWFPLLSCVHLNIFPPERSLRQIQMCAWKKLCKQYQSHSLSRSIDLSFLNRYAWGQNDIFTIYYKSFHTRNWDGKLLVKCISWIPVWETTNQFVMWCYLLRLRIRMAGLGLRATGALCVDRFLFWKLKGLKEPMLVKHCHANAWHSVANTALHITHTALIKQCSKVNQLHNVSQ